jgi:hypothetical protein
MNKETDPRLLSASRRASGSGNSFYGKSHSEETRKRISLTKTLSNSTLQQRLDSRSGDFDLITPIEQYTSRQRQYLEFKCRKCGSINQKTLQAFERGSLCDVCHPAGVSQDQSQIQEWLGTCDPISLQDISPCDRSVIAPKELDLVVPKKRFAIEFNGLYWHSELSSRDIDKRSHLEKTLMCREAGWRLFHIFSDEWRDKQDIVKSMILHRLGSSRATVGARNCSVVELTPEQRSSFFDRSHISGDSKSHRAWGLQLGGETLCALSVREPRQKKWKSLLEIARFATLPHHHVSGGLQRLLEHAKKHAQGIGKVGLLSYADLRFGEGMGYRSAGFELIGDTGLDYWYTDGQVRIDRFSMRAQDGLSERQVASLLKMGRVWGCGSNIWVLMF